MGSFTRFTRYIKDFWKVFIRGENDDLRRQTLSMEEELARLRSRRLASAKEREAEALNQARTAVQRLRDLHDNLIAAEKAAAEFASKLGETARSTMEADRAMREQTYKKFFAQQKQQMFTQQTAPELPSDRSVPISCSIEQGNESGVSKLKTSRATEDKDIMFAAVGAVQATAERDGADIRQSMINPEEKGEASASELNTSETIDNMELMDDVPSEALAQMLEDARKQVWLEEKLHVDALSRDKAIVEKEIEDREIAQRARMPPD